MTVLIGCVWTGPGTVAMYKAACTAGRGLEPRTARSTLPHPLIIVSVIIRITVHRGLWGAEGDYKHVYRHGVVVAARYNGLGY